VRLTRGRDIAAACGQLAVERRERDGRAARPKRDGARPEPATRR
jgi:hypothetical protein